MKPTTIHRRWSSVLFTILLVTSLHSVLFAKSSRPPHTVAFCETSPDYQRIVLPSGHYKTETYALAEGNLIDEAREKDASLNRLNFAEISDILAESLEEADYVPTHDLKNTDLLIVVSWGKTKPSLVDMGDFSVELARSVENLDQFRAEGGAKALPYMESEYQFEMLDMINLQQMSQQTRLRANDYNATLLGYEYAIHYDHRTTFTERDQLLNELESPRYFVVLQVYDFQKLWKEKERDLLWTSRFSIRAKGRQFDEELRNMALATCKQYGQASTKLERRLKPAHVNFGELEYIGVENN